jgi:uncharacterized protein (TIGR02246 family)
MRHPVSRRTAVIAAALLAGVSVAAPLRAYDFRLAPNAFGFAPGATREVSGQTSGAFPTSESRVAPDRLADVEVSTAAGDVFRVRSGAGARRPTRLAASGVVRAPAQPGRDSTAVADVVTRYHRALADGDSAAALALLAPDAVILESGGLETRAEYRSHHLPADIGFARALPSVRGAMRVVVEGNAAWAMSTSTTKGEYRSRAIDSASAELMVLTRGPDGRWLIRAIHWSSRPRRP